MSSVTGVEVEPKAKKRIHVTIDCDLYNLAQVKYGHRKISDRINQLLSIDLHQSTEKQELIEKLHELAVEQQAIQDKLCELNQLEKQEQEEESNQDKILNWIRGIYERKGVVGLNLVKAECKRLHVNYYDILRIMEMEEIATINYQE